MKFSPILILLVVGHVTTQEPPCIFLGSGEKSTCKCFSEPKGKRLAKKIWFEYSRDTIALNGQYYYAVRSNHFADDQTFLRFENDRILVYTGPQRRERQIQERVLFDFNLKPGEHIRGPTTTYMFHSKRYDQNHADTVFRFQFSKSRVVDACHVQGYYISKKRGFVRLEFRCNYFCDCEIRQEE